MKKDFIFKRTFPERKPGLQYRIQQRKINPTPDQEDDRKAKLLSHRKYNEPNVARNLVKAVEVVGGVIFKNHPLTARGIPDFTVILKDRGMFFVETKSTGQRSRPIQIKFAQKVYNAVKTPTYVLDRKIDNMKDFFEFCYSECEGNIHYVKNPFKNQEITEEESGEADDDGL